LFRTTVENAIGPRLLHGQANAHIVAKKLGMSERTLARRLAEERITFIEVLQTVKASLACHYLEDDDIPLEGYLEAFLRAKIFLVWVVYIKKGYGGRSNLWGGGQGCRPGNHSRENPARRAIDDHSQISFLFCLNETNKLINKQSSERKQGATRTLQLRSSKRGATDPEIRQPTA
jgi:AraC-like DNA-binding protein